MYVFHVGSSLVIICGDHTVPPKKREDPLAVSDFGHEGNGGDTGVCGVEIDQ